MSDLLETGLAWLVNQLRQRASRIVTYRRGESAIALPAILGRSEFRESDVQDFATGFETRDFLIRASDLDLGAGPVLPEPGDTITCDGAAYAVLDLGGAGCFRFTDPYRTALRIHTKESA